MNCFFPLFAGITITLGASACSATSDSSTNPTEQSQDPLTRIDAIAIDEERAPILIRDDGITRRSAPPLCKPAFSTPTYAQPADDGVALASLLEGAGYGASSNSDWTDIASGNFCGGSEKELVLLKNRASYFSVMRGPTPYAVGVFNNESRAAHPWRAVTSGNLDADAFDEVVAVRKVTANGVPDVFVMKVNASSCEGASMVASAAVGNASNADWLDAAIGNFDGTRKIALLKASHMNFYLLGQKGSNLSIDWSSDLDTNAAYPWKGIAAGDLDGDGLDELVATRKVSDGRGATVIVYKWVRNSFRRVATSTFGNNGNSDWTGVTVGDFNGDGRGAIALTKNNHSNFAILELPPRSLTLGVVATSDLDTAAGQLWRGVTAVDWLGGDNNASELVAVRAAKDPYRADLFVYGNPYHRIARDSGLLGQKAEWDQNRNITASQMLKGMSEVHANTVSWTLLEPGDYDKLVTFLKESEGYCIEGQQVRVSVTVAPKGTDFDPTKCFAPANSELTSWDELDYFTVDRDGPRGNLCLDFIGWASALGRLAQKYPHLVEMGVDDMLHYPKYFTGEIMAEMQARMRQQAPWMSFAPVTYWNDIKTGPKDIGRTIDNIVFYFRNEKEFDGARDCVADPCAVNSVSHAPGEFADAMAFLPAGRRLQVGTYWGTKGFGDTFQMTSPRYKIGGATLPA